MKKVPISSEYITLGQFLKKTGWIDTGGQAKVAVQTLKITVNGEPENRRGRKIYPDDQVGIETSTYTVVSKA